MSDFLRPYSDAELIKRVETHAKDFDGWQKGVYDIWVRADKTAKTVDVFTDKVFTFSVADDFKPQFRMVCTGTSLTGSWALKNFKTYNSKGAAVLASDQFVRNSHAWGFHKGYRAYEQVKPFPFYRDNDLDNLAEEIGQIYNDEIIKSNCHCARKNGISLINYNWSAGCLVRNAYNQYQGWLTYMAKRPLSVTILKAF